MGNEASKHRNTSSKTGPRTPFELQHRNATEAQKSIIYEAMARKASKCISNAAASGAQCGAASGAQRGQELAEYRFFFMDILGM